jgi:hypothetical protein
VLYYLLSYTYGKSMDLASDPQADTITNFYNLAQDYGPSDYSPVITKPFGTATCW